jgi:hypothetical protein
MRQKRRCSPSVERHNLGVVEFGLVNQDVGASGPAASRPLLPAKAKSRGSGGSTRCTFPTPASYLTHGGMRVAASLQCVEWAGQGSNLRPWD